MTSHIRKHAAILREIAKAKPEMRKSILKVADKELMRCICECAKNTLNGNVKLHSHQKRKLARHKHILRQLVSPGKSWKSKRKVVVQSGGFLLPLLAPILGTVLSSIIN